MSFQRAASPRDPTATNPILAKEKLVIENWRGRITCVKASAKATARTGLNETCNKQESS